MKEESLVESVVEEKVEDSAISPVEEIEEKVAEIFGLDWTPLSNDKLEAHAEEILTGILERIPGLSVKTSPNQHQALSFGEGRGRVVAKIWYAKTKVCIETPVLEGRTYVVGQSRYLEEKIGLTKKDRAAIVKEIRTYIKDRGWG